MRFDVADPRAVGAADAVERADLIEQHGFYLVRAAGHRAAAETGQIGVGGVGTDAHAMLDRQRHGAAHGQRLRGVKAAGDVGAVDEGHHFGIQTHGPGAIAFADIAVQEQAAHRDPLFVFDVARRFGLGISLA